MSGGLGGSGRQRVFAVLRSLADVVLVAAGTVRAENYGPAAVPIAVVTRTAELDWQSPFFTEAKARPIILTVDGAPPENLQRAAEVADVILSAPAASISRERWTNSGHAVTVMFSLKGARR